MTEVEAYAPGKVILHGEHAVVYGTKAIAVSVGLHTTVTIKKSTGCVKVTFEELGIDTEFSLTDMVELRKRFGDNFSFSKLNSEKIIPLNADVIKELENFVGNHAFSSCREELKTASTAAFQSFLFLYLGIFDDLQSISVNIKTDLPVGAGLGSSASFGVALAGALLVSANRLKKHAIDKDLVNRWAYISEQFVHGNPSGLDNSVATFGGAVLFKKGEPLIHLKCSEIRVLLVNTEVPRSTKELVARVADLKVKDPELHKNIMDEINELVENVATELNSSGQTTAEYVARNQELLAQLNVSHPMIDLIVNVAKTHGLSAKLTGAGGGGCVFIQLPLNFSDESLNKLKESLIAKKLTKFWCITLGGEGISVKL